MQSSCIRLCTCIRRTKGLPFRICSEYTIESLFRVAKTHDTKSSRSPSANQPLIIGLIYEKQHAKRRHPMGLYHHSSAWWQCAVMCCSALHCVAAEKWNEIMSRSFRKRVCCNVLQCDAVCCSVLQCVTVCCSVLQCVARYCSVLQCVAVYCTVLQCIAAYCSLLKCDAVCCKCMYCNVLQCLAVCCNVLQCVKLCCSMDME